MQRHGWPLEIPPVARSDRNLCFTVSDVPISIWICGEQEQAAQLCRPVFAGSALCRSAWAVYSSRLCQGKSNFKVVCVWHIQHCSRQLFTLQYSVVFNGRPMRRHNIDISKQAYQLRQIVKISLAKEFFSFLDVRQILGSTALVPTPEKLNTCEKALLLRSMKMFPLVSHFCGTRPETIRPKKDSGKTRSVSANVLNRSTYVVIRKKCC